MVKGLRKAWLSALVIGAACGLLVLELPILGYPLLVGGLVLVLRQERRVGAGGLAIGLGTVSAALLISANLRCDAMNLVPGQSCEAVGSTAWIVGALVLLVIGIGLTVVGRRRASA